ncbi:MAG: class I SAM-dependent methyltransferase [Chloroflexota bacterium]|nr:class I SAM-dependent methyltransferase [Chloroflexota bacterium]
MKKPVPLPDTFLRELEALEEVYLRNSDPIEQSGFYGESERWRAEREPILDGVASDGDFLDVGCANGYLLECLVGWGRERRVALEPYGLDQGRRLIELARRRYPHLADHFFVGNAWDWEPPQRFRYVYTLLDQVPPDYIKPYLHRLLDRVVAPGGRLIVGDYGSRSQGIPARDVAGVLRSAGLLAAGKSEGGSDGIARFAWSERGG